MTHVTHRQGRRSQREHRAALVPLPRPDDDTDRRAPAVRRRRVGPLRAHALHRPPPLRPDLQATGSGSSGRAWRRSPPTGGALLVANHAGAIPSDAPAIMHGIEEELGRPGLRPGRLLLPDAPGGRHHVVAYRRRAGPPRQRLPAPARPAAAGPGVPRGHQGAPPRPTPTATGCAASAGAGSSRSPCGPACPSSPSPWWAPRSRCPSCSGSPAWPRSSAPLLPGHRQLAALRARSGYVTYFPAKFKLRVLDPVSFDVPSRTRSATRGAGSWTRPRPSAARMQDALYDMLRERRSVWFG